MGILNSMSESLETTKPKTQLTPNTNTGQPSTINQPIPSMAQNVANNLNSNSLLMKSAEQKGQRIALTQQRQGLLDQRTRIANNEKIWGKVKNGDYGEQLRATHTMKVGVFATPPKTETPQAAKTVMEVPRPSAIEVQKPAASLSTSSYAAMSYAKPSMTKQQLIAVENEKRRQQALNHFNANYPLLSK